MGEETKARSVACRSKVAVVGSAWRRGPKRPRQPGDYFSLTTWAQVTRCHRAVHLGLLQGEAMERVPRRGGADGAESGA